MPEGGGDTSDSLEALVAALSPLFEERCYKGGAYLAREGEAADSLIYIEDGEADICFSMRQRADEDLLDDEEEVSACPSETHDSLANIGQGLAHDSPGSHLHWHASTCRGFLQTCVIKGIHSQFAEDRPHICVLLMCWLM
jgi:hypothetical protein